MATSSFNINSKNSTNSYQHYQSNNNIKKKQDTLFDISEDQKQEIKEAFDLFDNENKNYIEAKELKVALRALNFECDKNEVEKILKNIDKSEDSVLNYEEFSEILAFKMLERDPIEELKKNFNLLSGEDNIITFELLKKTVDELGENMSNEELNEIINETAGDVKSGITEEDFINIFKAHSGIKFNN